MTPVQLALLIVGLGAALLLLFISRRSRGQKNFNGEGERGGGKRSKAEQLDMFSATGQFDEFGVGPVRPARVGGGTAPALPRATAAAQPKTVALLIAEREGTHILGIKIHSALKAHGLQFGQGEIYHRVSQGEPVFSVAGILKPGTLNPAESARFSTPGLSMFITFPGPLPALTAFREFVATAQSLAAALNADVFDMRKKPLTPEALAALERDVDTWARANPML